MHNSMELSTTWDATSCAAIQKEKDYKKGFIGKPEGNTSIRDERIILKLIFEK
jgi:hypothetical protein